MAPLKNQVLFRTGLWKVEEESMWNLELQNGVRLLLERRGDVRRGRKLS
jgi:hypothetical protein